MNLQVEQLGSAMRIVPFEPLSVEQFWRFSADHPDLRMEREPNGDVVIRRWATLLTGYRNALISSALFGWAEQEGSGYALGSGVGYTLMDSSVRSANASWISAQQWTPDDEDDEANVLAPDFVIELRSKADRLKTAQEKMQSWIANGVQLGWLIDPQRRVVEIYRRGETEPTTWNAPASVAGEAPVAGFVLELESIWGKA